MAAPPDFLQVAYRPDLGILIIRWLREVSATEMRAGYEQLLGAARQHGSRYWLMDIRRRNNADPATAQWITDEFMPALAAHLGGPAFISYLLSPAHLHRVVHSAEDTARVAQMRLSTRVTLFIEESPANAWLAEQQRDELRGDEALAGGIS